MPFTEITNQASRGLPSLPGKRQMTRGHSNIAGALATVALLRRRRLSNLQGAVPLPSHYDAAGFTR